MTIFLYVLNIFKLPMSRTRNFPLTLLLSLYAIFLKGIGGNCVDSGMNTFMNHGE